MMPRIPLPTFRQITLPLRPKYSCPDPSPPVYPFLREDENTSDEATAAWILCGLPLQVKEEDEAESCSSPPSLVPDTPSSAGSGYGKPPPPHYQDAASHPPPAYQFLNPLLVPYTVDDYIVTLDNYFNEKTEKTKAHMDVKRNMPPDYSRAFAYPVSSGFNQSHERGDSGSPENGLEHIKVEPKDISQVYVDVDSIVLPDYPAVFHEDPHIRRLGQLPLRACSMDPLKPKAEYAETVENGYAMERTIEDTKPDMGIKRFVKKTIRRVSGGARAVSM